MTNLEKSQAARVEHLWDEMADDMLAAAKKAKPDITTAELTKLRRASIQVLTVLVVAHGHGVDLEQLWARSFGDGAI